MKNLESTFYAIGIVAFLSYLFSGVFDVVTFLQKPFQGNSGIVSGNSSTTGERAVASFTNRSGTKGLYYCFRGVVTNIESKKVVETEVACTGIIPPYATVRTEAYYRVGQVKSLCNVSQKIGNEVFERLDWSKCEFTILDAK